jgi:PAS domain S-box-containing protein
MRSSETERRDSDAEAPKPVSFGQSEASLLELAAKFFVQSATRREPRPAEHSADAPLRDEHLPTAADRFRVLVEQIPAVVFMVFLDGGFSEAYVSPQIEQMLGFSQEEWLDDPLRWYEQIHPEDKQRWSVEAANLLLTGNQLKSTYRVLARDGKVVWFRCEAKMVRRRDGEPWFVHGVGFDITELKETELALQRETAERERLQRLELERQIAKTEQTESRLAAIVESSEDAIIGKTLEGIVTNWNAAAIRLFGYEPREIIGKSILLLVPPELHAEENEILRRLSAGERIAHQQSRRLTKAGVSVDVSLTISPIKDAAGRVIGVSTIARDITERKRAEEALRTSEKLAATGRLAATIAHEVNNPLEAISNLLYLAKRRPEQSLKYLQTAEQELERVSQITRQTLGFYRDTSSAAPIDLATVLDDVLFLYAKKMQVRQINVLRDYGKGATVTGFGGEIRQIFANLIGNAIDAMPQGGSLTLRVSSARVWGRSATPGLRVSIGDTGTGIEREHMKKIFEPFYTTKKDVGTGLGLWLTRNLVERHGGLIQVRSRTVPGRSGTVFSVFLPASPPVTEATGTLALAAVSSGANHSVDKSHAK